MIRWCMTHECGWSFAIHDELKSDNQPCVEVQDYTSDGKEYQ